MGGTGGGGTGCSGTGALGAARFGVGFLGAGLRLRLGRQVGLRLALARFLRRLSIARGSAAERLAVAFLRRLLDFFLGAVHRAGLRLRLLRLDSRATATFERSAPAVPGFTADTPVWTVGRGCARQRTVSVARIPSCS